MHNHDFNKKRYFERGWCHFGFDAGIKQWVNACLPYAREAVLDANNGKWLRCGGTWFVGVNALLNRANGSLADGPSLEGEAIGFIHDVLQVSEFDWDRAQVSVCYPGYPQPMPSESEAAFRFRRDRDAAHVDGLLPEGATRRRHLRQYHGFVLGVPMVKYCEKASPLVVWEGSHELVRAAMLSRFGNLAADQWSEEDITEAYHAVRNQIFKQCRRVVISANPGETYLLHRLTLHGISPWLADAETTNDGRMICYFRPETGGAWEWLNGL